MEEVDVNEITHVKHLILEDRCNDDLMRKLFGQKVADSILSLPLQDNHSPNDLVWSLAKKRRYFSETGLYPRAEHGER